MILKIACYSEYPATLSSLIYLCCHLPPGAISSSGYPLAQRRGTPWVRFLATLPFVIFIPIITIHGASQSAAQSQPPCVSHAPIGGPVIHRSPVNPQLCFGGGKVKSFFLLIRVEVLSILAFNGLTGKYAPSFGLRSMYFD